MGESIHLSELQLAIMRVLWDRGEATVLEVQQALETERKLARTTVATLLSRMMEQGVIARRKHLGQFRYRPLVEEADVRTAMLDDLRTSLFRGSSTAIVSQLLGDETVDAEELDQIIAMIESYKRASDDDE